MILTKTWERYFLHETIKIFLLVLCIFYGLYVLIDYTSHSNAQHYQHSHYQWSEFMRHYFYEWIVHADVLIPFAILIATTRTLCQLSVNNELIALMASGIKCKKLLLPFVFFGLCCTFLMYLNTEYFLPQALKEIRHAHDAHTLIKHKKNLHTLVQDIVLPDESILLFQEYDPSSQQFFDAYLIRSFDDIYRIERFQILPNKVTGYHVDHLTRNENGQLMKHASYDKKNFPDIRWSQHAFLDTITPPEEFSISELWTKLPPLQKKNMSEKESAIASALYQKAATPWLCLLAVIAPAPFCVRFTRHLPVFFIYALSIFSLIASYLIFESSAVLGSRQVLPPLWAAGTPFAFIMGVAFWKFAQVK